MMKCALVASLKISLGTFSEVLASCHCLQPR